MKLHQIKLRIRVLSCVMALALVSTFASAFATSATHQTSKVLFVTDTTEYSRINSTNSSNAQNEFVDFATLDNVDESQLSSYEAVALPYNESTRIAAKTAFENGSIVYLYGELTIQDYKECVGLENYALTIPIYKGESAPGEVLQYFDPIYEAEEIFNVISYSDFAMLCKINKDIPIELAEIYGTQDVPTAEVKNTFLTAVEKNFSTLKQRVATRTIVESDYDIIEYFGPYDFSIHLDYTLHQNDSDRDPDYDYFGVKTKVWVDNGSGDVSRLQTKYELPYTTDNLLETGPTSQSNIGELNVSVGYGETGPTGSISYSVDLSDTSPTIARDEDFSSDIVEWDMTPKTFLPIYLDNSNLSCSATWASAGGSLAAIDVFVAGRVNIGPGGVHPIDSGYFKTPIVFKY